MPSGSTLSLTDSDKRACWVGYGDGSLQDYLARTCRPVRWFLNRLHEIQSTSRSAGSLSCRFRTELQKANGIWS